ncbi:bifunctional proline dehydrogenase/L-glutamate gamma-semialdehyde dehydrogenase PutA [Lentilitoribacter sp. Alg239-R112]|uniref:bifunctional proline dehydrogenase/L-glutamate gamma-semialdehyde dehydrogenase PutA n=1 Tax=Lentilitoribacter sp. Alg239-R112 TaxID=2305987 RepID=UPI0013A6DAA5|nr:bifunctional proline dehydrogenase/L-glutamate gamma-semialdehyde dehydrogenase PutA [Lentilitoribacter sp. Alg239-R112]
MNQLLDIRSRIRNLHMIDETSALKELSRDHGLGDKSRAEVSAGAAELVRNIRKASNPGLMEVFLAEYGLSTQEGIALMCLAEALLRVPDAHTIDELIEDKIAPSSWGEHLGQSSSSLVNASTWALMLTGKVLQEPESEGLADTLHAAVRRLGEPLIRTAVKRAMKEMGHQFVLGQTISEAVKRGQAMEKKGFTYSYDMLGEAALTAKDADAFFTSYSDAIKKLARYAKHEDIRKNPGISIKLSALHPRYEVAQRERVMKELVPRVKVLADMAKEAQMGLNIDAEEADRLDLSLDVIEEVLRAPQYAGWNGFGVVVQAYSKRCPAVIDWLYSLANETDRNIMVRLVKGAYWDTEIKQAQVDGVNDFPVFTDKAATDVSYICCARKLLNYSDRIYPQFATHNAHTVSAILHMAEKGQSFEFQRLHGMGEELHKLVLDQEGTRCRIYAPVGAHRDLLAYLVRRLLENGANSSFVNQLVDEDVSPETIAEDPFRILRSDATIGSKFVKNPNDIYQPERPNSVGWDLRNFDDLVAFEKARETFKSHEWIVKPMISGSIWCDRPTAVYSPNNAEDQVGFVTKASLEQVENALVSARNWGNISCEKRSAILNKAADLYEENAGEIFAALCREAGKTALDAVAEIREAVDFLRYYGAEAIRLGDLPERGIITCISPWNFPLAIFTGQISAGLAAGNGVLAKPADPTPIIASIGVRLMHKAGVPKAVLQLIPGKGSVVGAKLTTDKRINGICFTGSTGVAQMIYRDSAAKLEPDSTFIAETGGLNAMIVDSTALPEQAIKDIVDSSFRSCGQRCSALRMLYLQKDIADEFLEMLYGAMDELEISDPWNMSSDVGPVITASARREIVDHIDQARAEGTLLKQLDAPQDSLFVGPAVIKVGGVLSLEKEIFGPVLHICTFEATEIDQIISDINASGYGLTFGLHTRIDDRVEYITSKINVGNIYVNRNQIGAVVGSQPFGGEGLSGTGPKAGGSHYVRRFKRLTLPEHDFVEGNEVEVSRVQTALNEAITDTHTALETIDMPGPTGESNRWSIFAKGTILCLGPTASLAESQMEIAHEMGCAAVGVAPGLTGANTISGVLPRAALSELKGFEAVALWSDRNDLLAARQALASRAGALLPLIATNDMKDLCLLERHLCIDTTAAGGNTSLLAAQ